MTTIGESAGSTALHVAIDLDEKEVVEELVNVILTHSVEVGEVRVQALEIKNERGDTPLHIAASRGLTRICKSIIGDNNERIYLLSLQNKHGETPLFQAAINYRKQTFAYLAHISGATALHVAIDLDEKEVVEELVNVILTHSVEVGEVRVQALEIRNERGDTPLHNAASLGLTRICRWIIGNNNERIYLLSLKNEHGETPLFQAAINWRKQAFAYLAHISKERVTLQDLIRNDGDDSILHIAIMGDYFDMAVIIAQYYGFLSTYLSKEGSTPLKLLAYKPSAFESSSNLPWYKRIVYNYIHVEPVDAERITGSIFKMMEEGPADQVSNKFPKSYGALCDFVSIGLIPTLFGKKFSKKKRLQHDLEDPSNYYRRPIGSENYPVGFLPNYKTFHQFVRRAFVLTLGLFLDLKDVKIAKKKHQRSSQLLKVLMKRPYAAFTGSGGRPTDREIDSDMYNVFPQWKQGGASSIVEEEEEEQESEVDVIKETTSSSRKENEIMKVNEKEIDKKMTPFLVAAKNGIVEMVNEILDKIPNAIHNTNSRKENVFHVAVKSRQPLIVETLRRTLIYKYSKYQYKLWESLIFAKDDRQNTILHLAAEALGGGGSALQMMWDIKWFQYIKSFVPEHFCFISNNDGNTAREIFKNSHVDLIKESSEWLKDTSESGSVVAVLIAGASFTTASSVPGGTTEGRPILEGNPAFNVFVFASLSGLCFSFTALIMFLSVLTSQKQVKDFRKLLPLKLYIGLSSLFLAITSMFVSFCTGYSFLLSHKFKWILFPMYAAACFPVAFYGAAQIPLYYYLLSAIFTSMPRAIDNGDNF